jgi:hypothetical protein
MCERIADREMASRGYQQAGSKPDPLALMGSGGALLCKSMLALTLNVSRTRSALEAARRRLGA